jgi:hydrogenase expression/formation protein HypC
MRVLEVSGQEGVAETGGVRRPVRFDLLDEVAAGDFVLIHAGFAIQRLDESEAAETLKLLREYVAAGEEGSDLVPGKEP